ncbi:transcription termination factor 3, mitochondrial isoform X2 [Vanessa cardui]|uniref:transcription termination factor 3, mitochondrial isoform X2 n=1 Tax=Vanessa cardui TaxID=171605 RepID=UPI001F12C7FA|nr:transcription termination factor 3, mitochondrial isoform X2 [Vanessa cardui]
MFSLKMDLCHLVRLTIAYNANITMRRNLSSVVLANSLAEVKHDQNNTVLESVSEDLSEVTPYFPESFNIAAYVNKSETLQNLVKLNVNLSKIEKKPHIVNKLLKMDFEKDMKENIFFIKDFVDSENIGNYITKNPLILCESIENFQVRINYLQSKSFSNLQIHNIIARNPFWLMFSTERIDKRLGYFQNKFSLNGNEVRLLATKQPKIITYSIHHINTNSFVVKEEMGFNDEEVKTLLLNKPKIWMTNQKSLLERFNYLHNVIKIPHSSILHYPNVLLCRNFKVKQRHMFLETLGRAQYDANKENYIPLKALIENTDSEFCKNYAKCNVDDFNLFLKTL